MDRVHRIGQTKPVHVYRLATAHSVEGKMLKRAQSKLVLEKVVMLQGGFHNKEKVKLNASELVSLFRDDSASDDEKFPQSADISDADLDVRAPSCKRFRVSLGEGFEEFARLCRSRHSRFADGALPKQLPRADLHACSFPRGHSLFSFPAPQRLMDRRDMVKGSKIKSLPARGVGYEVRRQQGQRRFLAHGSTSPPRSQCNASVLSCVDFLARGGEVLTCMC